jgi:hypothetical protein
MRITHFNCPAFFTTKYNSADEMIFKKKVEKTGSQCTILHKGDSMTL